MSRAISWAGQVGGCTADPAGPNCLVLPVVPPDTEVQVHPAGLPLDLDALRTGQRCRGPGTRQGQAANAVACGQP
jgi:hypothetical protein